MWAALVGLVTWLIGWLTGRSANRDEELGTVKAENQQLRDDIDVIKRTDDAVKNQQGGTSDPDDLDGVRGPPTGRL